MESTQLPATASTDSMFSVSAEVAAIRAISALNLNPALLKPGDLIELQSEGFLCTLTWNAQWGVWSSTSRPADPQPSTSTPPTGTTVPNAQLKLLQVHPTLVSIAVGPGAPSGQVFQLHVSAHSPLPPGTATRSSAHGRRPGWSSAPAATVRATSDAALQAVPKCNISASQPEVITPSEDDSQPWSYDAATANAAHKWLNELTGAPCIPGTNALSFPDLASRVPPPGQEPPFDGRCSLPGVPHGAHILQMPPVTGREAGERRDSTGRREGVGDKVPCVSLCVLCNGVVLPVRAAVPCQPQQPQQQPQQQQHNHKQEQEQARTSAEAAAAQRSSASSMSAGGILHNWLVTIDCQSIMDAGAGLASPTHLAAQIQLWSGSGNTAVNIDMGYIMLMLTPTAAPPPLKPEQWPLQPDSCDLHPYVGEVPFAEYGAPAFGSSLQGPASHNPRSQRSLLMGHPQAGAAGDAEGVFEDVRQQGYHLLHMSAQQLGATLVSAVSMPNSIGMPDVGSATIQGKRKLATN